MFEHSLIHNDSNQQQLQGHWVKKLNSFCEGINELIFKGLNDQRDGQFSLKLICEQSFLKQRNLVKLEKDIKV